MMSVLFPSIKNLSPFVSICSMFVFFLLHGKGESIITKAFATLLILNECLMLQKFVMFQHGEVLFVRNSSGSKLFISIQLSFTVRHLILCEIFSEKRTLSTVLLLIPFS